jgi:hypothetical protein
MSDVAVNVSGPSSFSAPGFDAGVTSMSADSLLAYCQIQLGDLDSQINGQMTAQKTALREREAVQSAQAILGQFGTTGPTKTEDMQRCVDALNSAIKQLPSTDPVAGQLADFRDRMTAQYQYVPGRALTVGEQQKVDDLKIQMQALTGLTSPAAGMTTTNAIAVAALQRQVTDIENVQKSSFKAPDKDAKEWQGTTDALATVSDDIKSSAEIQMLHLQDLVSQRQQAVQLCSGIMSKTDQSLEDQAKAIGR